MSRRVQAYHEADLPAVLDRAWAAGVSRIIITATNAAEAHQALALARTDGESSLSRRLAYLQRCARSSPSRVPTKAKPSRTGGAAERLFCTVGVHPTRCGEFDDHPGGPDAYMAELTRIVEDGQTDGKASQASSGMCYARLAGSLDLSGHTRLERTAERVSSYAGGRNWRVRPRL